MQPTRSLVHIPRWSFRQALPTARKMAMLLSETMGLAWRVMIGEQIEERLARVPNHEDTGDVDPFGLDLQWGKYGLTVAGFLYRHYFRTEVHGLEHLPAGRVLLVANHSGQIPIDGAVIGGAIFFDAEPPRILRSMVEKWSQTLPFISVLFSRMGQVVGVPENAKRLLELEETVLVFPEGARGISKPFRQRYQLTEFGLGFMRLALETQTPIVPVAVIGAEEQYVNLANLASVAKMLHVPSFPVIPQLLIPGLQLPLPTKYRLYFGEPMQFHGDADDDDGVIEEKVWIVKATIQAMINRGLKERKGIFS